MKFDNIRADGEVTHFTVTVEDTTGRQWEEKYSKATDDAHEWARVTVEKFNQTLRTGELPRRLIKVVVNDVESKHNWRKVSMATQTFRGRPVDVYRCDKCGITGKRYGLSDLITIDSKYRAKKFDTCNSEAGEVGS